MRSEGHHYNQLLLKYRAYQRKLQRLTEFGKNLHRQQVLRKHLERLKKRLYVLRAALEKRKASHLAVGAFLLGMLSAEAQLPTFKEKLTPTQEIGLANFGADVNEYYMFTAFGDLDGDGDLDLIAASYYNSNAIFYYENTGSYDQSGKGTPYFQLVGDIQSNNAPISFDSRTAPRLYDLDGDGDLDMLTHDYNGDFYYYENLDIDAETGDTTISGHAFASPVQNGLSLSNIGASNYAVTFGLADLDGDGDADLLIQGEDNNLYYFENLDIEGADQTLSGALYANSVAAPFNLPAVGSVYFAMDFVDLDADGDLDILYINSDNDFSYMENKDIDVVTTLPLFSDPIALDAPYFGDAQPLPFGLPQISALGWYNSLSVADLDGDGDSDFLLYVDERKRAVYFKNLDIDNGTFAGGDPEVIDTPRFQEQVFVGLSFGTSSKPALVDIDGDGDIDLLSGNNRIGFQYFKNLDIDGADANIDAIYFEQQIIEGVPGSGDNLAPALADVNNDGDLDLLVGDFGGNFSYFENSGDNTTPLFAAAQTNPFNLRDIGKDSTPFWADMDNDGDYDVLAGNRDGNFSFFENSGDHTEPEFAAKQTNPFGLVGIGTNSAPALVDLNGDGDLDLLSGESNGEFYYFENTGTVTVPDFQQVQQDAFSSFDVGILSSPAFADLDGDGDKDLLFGNWAGMYYYFENVDQDLDNDGILDAVEVTFGAVSYSIWGDEDGDGIPNYKDTLDNGDDGDGSTTHYSDTNTDGIADIFDTDLDGRPNYIDLDSDNDGIPDVIEAQITDGFTAPALTYGADDGVDTNYTGGLTPIDTDNDGIPDFLDDDSDNDGQPDMFETGFTLNAQYEDNGLDSAFDYTGYADPTAGKNFSDYENNTTEYAFRDVAVTLTNYKLFMTRVSLLKNPVQTHFEIVGLKEPASLRIFAISGILVKQKNDYSGGRVDCGSLNTGIYFVEVTSQGFTKVLQLIKE